MTPYEQAEALYTGRPDMDFGMDLMMHCHSGYVLANPTCIALVRPVRKDWHPKRFEIISQAATPEAADCWFVWLLCGSLREAVKYLPYPLPWFGFSQRGQPARFVEAEKVLAKIG